MSQQRPSTMGCPSKGVQNLTSVSEFLLLGLSEDPELQPILFGLFLSMYLVTVLGNLLIILAVSSDSHLHTPMYFFLSNLSLTDIGFISTVVPKMLMNIQTHSRIISYVGCLSQMSIFMLFVCMDDMLLTVMAYDRLFPLKGKCNADEQHRHQWFYLPGTSHLQEQKKGLWDLFHKYTKALMWGWGRIMIVALMSCTSAEGFLGARLRVLGSM
ncbi:Olfactory receptor 7E24 [Sciurus carolinensis]|uniref:Olfactory receptor 7E24 n=1 Tax=Sciurus carolinensis TaxID=30640 RepID=A0AA41NAU8_SCICA|nr:Olfactory receptor 7E24 [Sciurus carolinensis]